MSQNARLVRPLRLVAIGLAAGAVLAGAALGRAPAPSLAQSGAPQSARAALRNIDGAEIGTVEFRQDGAAVRVVAAVQNLPPGFHAFHVHAAGSCDPSTAFMSAQGHFNPGGVTHADHAGDMPSLYVLADGTAEAGFFTDRFTVADLLGPAGAAVIVHAGPDNFGNIPSRYADAPDAMTLATGDAGGRTACGVVAGG